MKGDGWYLHTESGPQGPYSAEDLRAWLAAGSITAEWSVWREGMAGWETIGSLLSSSVAPNPPSPPPPPPPPAEVRPGPKTNGCKILAMLAGILLVGALILGGALALFAGSFLESVIGSVRTEPPPTQIPIVTEIPPPTSGETPDVPTEAPVPIETEISPAVDSAPAPPATEAVPEAPRPDTGDPPVPPMVELTGAKVFRWSDGDWIVQGQFRVRNRSNVPYVLRRDRFAVASGTLLFHPWSPVATLPEEKILPPDGVGEGSVGWYTSRSNAQPSHAVFTLRGAGDRPLWESSITLDRGTDSATFTP